MDRRKRQIMNFTLKDRDDSTDYFISNKIATKLVVDAFKGRKLCKHGTMCGGCAFRHGTEANKSPHTALSAMESILLPDEIFVCHMVEGQTCVGYLHALEFNNLIEKE